MRTCGECDASSSTKLQSKALIPLIRRHYVGPNGRLRASHREIAAENLDNLGEADYRSLMGPAYVCHPHTSTQPLSKGEIVELDISLWPGGMVFDAGEGLGLEIKGHNPILPEFVELDEKVVNHKAGRHRVHTGGDCPSQVMISVRRGFNELVQAALQQARPIV